MLSVISCIIEVLATLVENTIIMYLLISFFGEKHKFQGKIYATCTFVLINIIGVCLIFNKHIGLLNIVGLLAIVLYSFLCLNGSNYKKTILISALFMGIGCINATILGSFSLFTRLKVSELIQYGTPQKNIILILSKLVLFIIVKYVLIKCKKIELYLAKKEMTILLVLFMSLLVESMLLINVMASGNVNDVQKITLLLMEVCFVLINLIIFGLITEMSKKNRLLMEEKIISAHLEEKEKSYIEIQALYNKLRIIKHDIKHYKSVINSICINNEEQRKYLKEIDNKLDVFSEEFFYTNNLFGSIISSKISIAKEKNINVKYSILCGIPDYMEMDTSILFSNIFENAMDACENQINPRIKIKIYYEEPYIYFIVSNSISESVIKDNPKLITSKDNREEHGIGLRSVKSIVEKYNGMCVIQEEENMFVVNICLKNSRRS